METPLSVWESYYVIVGSSGAALTGLQFVVIALVAESQSKSSERDIAAFGTPTIVHFCTVLVIAAILSAPWKGLGGPSSTIAALGAGGVAYAILTTLRARRTGYQPVAEDWVWHVILPLLSHVALVISGLMIRQRPEEALFVVGGVALMFLIIGIHNAWDTVTFIALLQARGLPLVPEGDDEAGAPPPAAPQPSTPPAS
jgi:hypothetical protein